LKLSYTANKFRNNPDTKDFIQSYQKLKQDLPIIDTLSDTTSPAAADTLTDTNDSIKNYSSDTEKFKEIQAPGGILKISVDQLFSKFADEETLKQYKQYQEKFKDHVVDDQADAKSPDYQEYLKFTNKFVGETQEKLANDTQTIMRQRTITSAIAGLAHYFDSSTLRDNNF